MQTVDVMRKMLNEPNTPKPQLILLTGGASQMPIVKEVLTREFPGYRIVDHEASKAIARGAARFATVEHDQQIHTILQRTNLDLVIRFTRPDNTDFMDVMIPRNTPLPFSPQERGGHTLSPKQSRVDVSLWEAVKTDPDTNQPDRDYKKVIPMVLDHTRSAESEGKTTLHNVTRISIDKNNIIHMEAWEPGRERDIRTNNEKPYKRWD
jgi:molecular chaperone DnaK (HSP70)